MSFFQLLGGSGGSKSLIEWTFFIFLFMFVLPKLYFYQIFAKLDASARKLEDISKDGQNEVVKKTSKYGKDKKEIRRVLSRFIDFFMVEPVNLDPYGILRKFEHLIDNTEHRFKQVAKEIAPKSNDDEMMNVYMGLQAAVVIHTIAKVVRHYVELVKKFKNLQFALLLQMQLPMIEKLVESERKGLDTFLNGNAIGDGAGPLVVASMVSKEGKEIAENVVTITDEKWGRKITFVKAKGPGGRLGKIGEAVKLICKKYKIAKIITVDAAAKLEGEKTGSVAEGTGVAMGGVGVQRAKIEEIAVGLNIPLDAIAIKMSQFEAISPMPEKVLNAIDDAKSLLKERILDVKKGGHIVVVGVGNTCGIPNTNKNLKLYTDKIKKIERKLKKEEEEKNKGWFKEKKSKESQGLLSILYSKGLLSII